MSKWKVSVCRIGYSHLDIVVEADGKREATDKAIDVAGNYEFSEHDADYTSDGAQEVTA